ncbi:hypothetical protein D9M68_924320 [compost metagenome]
MSLATDASSNIQRPNSHINTIEVKLFIWLTSHAVAAREGKGDEERWVKYDCFDEGYYGWGGLSSRHIESIGILYQKD